MAGGGQEGGVIGSCDFEAQQRPKGYAAKPPRDEVRRVDDDDDDDKKKKARSVAHSHTLAHASDVRTHQRERVKGAVSWGGARRGVRNDETAAANGVEGGRSGGVDVHLRREGRRAKGSRGSDAVARSVYIHARTHTHTHSRVETNRHE